MSTFFQVVMSNFTAGVSGHYHSVLLNQQAADCTFGAGTASITKVLSREAHNNLVAGQVDDAIFIAGA